MAEVKVLEEKGPLTAETLTKRKLGFLNFLAASRVDAREMVLHFLAASCDSSEPVARWVARRSALWI